MKWIERRSVTGIGLLAGVLLLWGTAAPVRAERIYQSWCDLEYRPPPDKKCPGSNDLILGVRTASGCEWLCCPPNNDGKTYDCSKRQGPTAASRLKGLRYVSPSGAPPLTQQPPAPGSSVAPRVPARSEAVRIQP